MPEQNLKNHGRYLPLYHFIILPLIFAAIIGSFINIQYARHEGDCLYSPVLICILSICALFIWFYTRYFALKAQDRAIRAEENFRHFILTGMPLDNRLRMSQVVALRFAADEEFVELAKKAVDTNMTSKEIKMAIKDWRADNDRV